MHNSSDVLMVGSIFRVSIPSKKPSCWDKRNRRLEEQMT
jgi:hypothetical protein